MTPRLNIEFNKLRLHEPPSNLVLNWQYIKTGYLRLNSEQMISISILLPFFSSHSRHSIHFCARCELRRENKIKFSNFFLSKKWRKVLAIRLWRWWCEGGTSARICVCSVRKIVVQWRWSSGYTLCEQRNYTVKWKHQLDGGRNTTIDNLRAFL